MTAHFEFWDYVDGDRNIIDEWLSAQPDDVRAQFDDDFSYLANVPIPMWTPPKTKMLRGKEFRQLREFRVTVERIRYRLLGFHGPYPREVTLCGAFAHGHGLKAEQSRAR